MIEVDSPDQTAFEQVLESLTGEEANPFLQLMLISIAIFGIVIFLKKGQKKRESVWDDDDIAPIEVPLEAPSMDLFKQDSDDESDTPDEAEVLPLPEEGLPEGWTMEQWQHYGHQYLSADETLDKQDKDD